MGGSPSRCAVSEMVDARTNDHADAVAAAQAVM